MFSANLFLIRMKLDYYFTRFYNHIVAAKFISYLLGQIKTFYKCAIFMLCRTHCYTWLKVIPTKDGDRISVYISQPVPWIYMDSINYHLHLRTVYHICLKDIISIDKESARLRFYTYQFYYLLIQYHYVKMEMLTLW